MNLGIGGKVALVCASTRGLGRAIAESLAGEGARVVVCGRDGDRARQLAATLPDALGLEADLTAPETPARLIATVEEQVGPVEILVLNGGGPPPGAAAVVTDAELASAFDALVLPQQRLVQLVLPGMRERGWGRILAIGSSGIVEPIPQLALSNSARAASVGFLMTLAREVAGDGVTVNVLLPGRIATERVAELDQAAAQRAGSDVESVRRVSEAAIPVGRYGRPEEFAAVAALYCSELASYATGSLVRVDGGMTRSH